MESGEFIFDNEVYPRASGEPWRLDFGEMMTVFENAGEDLLR